MGQRDLRRLLVTGAMSVVQQASRCGEAADPWLAGMLARKPKKVIAVALANRTARRVWAVPRGRKPTGLALRAEPGRRKEGIDRREKLPGDVDGRTEEAA